MATKGETQKIPSILRRIFRSRTWFFKSIRTRTRLRTTDLISIPNPYPYPYQFLKKNPYPSIIPYQKSNLFRSRLRTPDPGPN